MPVTPLRILYRDEVLVAVDKPPGLVVHNSELARTRDTCMRRLRSQLGCKVYPCHRLDSPTSGLLLFALSPEALEGVMKQFRERQVEKRYLGFCRGYLRPEQERVEDPIDGRWAATEFRTLEQYRVGCAVGRYPTARYSLLAIHPVSGRRQQIRRHLKRIGHPLVGDTRHGDPDHNHFLRQVFGFRRLFLHSFSLSLRHPQSGQAVDLRCELSPALQAFLEQTEEFRCGGTENRSMFYGSPFPPQQQPSSGGGQPPASPLGGGIPPAGIGGAAAKPPEELAFQEARNALKSECRDNVPLLMAETKKMGVAVLEACEVVAVAERRGLELDRPQILRQELQNQVMAYALMRFLPDDAWKHAAEATQQKIVEAMQANPPLGKAGVFVRELESQVKDTPKNRDAIQQWLVTQPLFRVLNSKPEAFANLEQHYVECAGKMNQIIQSTNETLTTLLHQQSNLRPGPQFRP